MAIRDALTVCGTFRGPHVRLLLCMLVHEARLLVIAAPIRSAMTPAEAGSKLSDTRRAQLHAGLIRSKLRSHTESATALYLAFKFHSKSGPLSLAQLRAGLERCVRFSAHHPACVDGLHVYSCIESYRFSPSCYCVVMYDADLVLMLPLLRCSKRWHHTCWLIPAEALPSRSCSTFLTMTSSLTHQHRCYQ